MQNTEQQTPVTLSFPNTITYTDFEPSEAVSADIQRYMAKLEKFGSRIVSCNVTVRAPQKSKHRKHIYHVHVQVNVPGDSLVVSREPEKNYDHSDIHIAVRDAFKAVETQLRSLHDKHARNVKVENPVAARVAAERSLETTELQEQELTRQALAT